MSTRNYTYETQELLNLRLKLSFAWCMLTCSFAAYAILKPSPRATELPLMPSYWGEWLDYAADFRTFIMTVLAGLIPAVLLASSRFDQPRRRFILIVTALLFLFELMQVFVPSRSVHPADLAYTVSGGGFLELVAVLLKRMMAQTAPMSETTPSPTATR